MPTLKQKFNYCLNTTTEIYKEEYIEVGEELELHTDRKIRLPKDFSTKFWGMFENTFPEEVEKRMFSSTKFSVSKIKIETGVPVEGNSDGIITGSECRKYGLSYEQCLSCVVKKGKWLNSSLIETACKHFLELKFSRSRFNAAKAIGILSSYGIKLNQKVNVCSGEMLLKVIKHFKLDKNELMSSLFGTIVNRAYSGLDVEKLNLPIYCPHSNINPNVLGKIKTKKLAIAVDKHEDHNTLWIKRRDNMWVVYAVYLDDDKNKEGVKNSHWKSAQTKMYDDIALYGHKWKDHNIGHAKDDVYVKRVPKVKIDKRAIFDDVFDEL